MSETMTSLFITRLSDERLSGLVAEGSAPAFDELYRRYRHRLAAYGGRMVGDAAAGEDVAQISLMNAYNALRKGGAPDRLRPWLYRIAHNAALELIGRRRELVELEELEADGDEREASATRGALIEALRELPERQRKAFVLRELRGLRVDEIGVALSLDAAQVEQALFAARSRLAEIVVFGTRLDCATVRRLLSGGPLDGEERTALRGHVRSCSSCRAAVAKRRLAGLWIFFPLDLLDALRRRLGDLLAGGGTAAKAAAAAGAAVAATAGVAVPLLVLDADSSPPAVSSSGGRASGPFPQARRGAVSTAGGQAAGAAPAAAPVVVGVSRSSVEGRSGGTEPAAGPARPTGGTAVPDRTAPRASPGARTPDQPPTSSTAPTSAPVSAPATAPTSTPTPAPTSPTTTALPPSTPSPLPPATTSPPATTAPPPSSQPATTEAPAPTTVPNAAPPPTVPPPTVTGP